MQPYLVLSISADSVTCRVVGRYKTELEAMAIVQEFAADPRYRGEVVIVKIAVSVVLPFKKI